MGPITSRRSHEPVVALRGVALVLRAGVPCCRAAAHVLVALDLTVCRGERVLVVGAPRDVGTRLLLVAGGLLRPDAGRVWTAPGARLVRADVVAHRAVRGVAEGPLASREALRWAADVGPGAELAVSEAGHAGAATRVLRYRTGRLHEAPLEVPHELSCVAARVDSASGAP